MNLLYATLLAVISKIPYGVKIRFEDLGKKDHYVGQDDQGQGKTHANLAA